MDTNELVNSLLAIALKVKPVIDAATANDCTPLTQLDIAHALHNTARSLESDLETVNGLRKFSVANWPDIVEINLNNRIEYKAINVVLYCYHILIAQGMSNEEILQLLQDHLDSLEQLLPFAQPCNNVPTLEPYKHTDSIRILPKLV